MDQAERTMAEQIFNVASIAMAEKGELAPMYFIILGGMMNPLVGAPDMPYQDLAAAAVNVAHETDADAIILICEQTALQFDKNDPDMKDYLDGIRRPSESPKAEDYLTLIYMSKDGQAESLIAKIHKSLNGIRHIKDDPKWIVDAATNIITPWA